VPKVTVAFPAATAFRRIITAVQGNPAVARQGGRGAGVQ
jgi:hypothetical protein